MLFSLLALRSFFSFFYAFYLFISVLVSMSLFTYIQYIQSMSKDKSLEKIFHSLYWGILYLLTFLYVKLGSYNHKRS